MQEAFCFFKCNSQLHRQPSVSLLLVVKHVLGMLSMWYTAVRVSHSKNPILKPMESRTNDAKPHWNTVQSLFTQKSSTNNSYSESPLWYSVQIVQYLVKVKYWIWIIYTKSKPSDMICHGLPNSSSLNPLHLTEHVPSKEDKKRDWNNPPPPKWPHSSEKTQKSLWETIKTQRLRC